MKAPKHLDQFDENEIENVFHTLSEKTKDLSANAISSYISQGVAENNALLRYLRDSRTEVEDEVVAIVDAMSMSIDAKGERLKALKAATERTSQEVAFMRQQLATVNAKAAEVDALTASMGKLVSTICDLKRLIDDGTLDKIAAAANAAASIR